MKITLACILASLTFSAVAATSPSELILKIYQVSVSLSADCSSPTTILSSVDGQEMDFMSNPVLGSGTLADGTYNCVMITMDDVIKYRPVANDLPGCTAGTLYAQDLCRNQVSSSGSVLFSHTDLLEGTTTTSTECAGTDQVVGSGGIGGIANKVTMYLRTTAPASAHGDSDNVTSWGKGTVLQDSQGPGEPAADAANGLQLVDPFIVAGTKTGVFYLDATGQVSNNGGNCEMNAPEFGFRDP
jgi:hypothetical protein